MVCICCSRYWPYRNIWTCLKKGLLPNLIFLFQSHHPFTLTFIMMCYKSLALPVAVAAIATLAVLVHSAPQSPATALAYSFAADAETLLKSPLQNSFKCEGQAYGEGSRRRKAPADANMRVHVLADYGRGVGRRIQRITGRGRARL